MSEIAESSVPIPPSPPPPPPPVVCFKCELEVFPSSSNALVLIPFQSIILDTTKEKGVTADVDIAYPLQPIPSSLTRFVHSECWNNSGSVIASASSSSPSSLFVTSLGLIHTESSIVYPLNHGIDPQRPFYYCDGPNYVRR